ncbi:MAG: hypothetical protein NT159_14040 [Proteobacteria bacterium]|nr:hypothetical protein [Pseudomonadota bacterium]
MTATVPPVQSAALPHAVLTACFLVAACATYDGRGLMPGHAEIEDVQRAMGEPAMRWQDPDGSVQLAYPRGPVGFHTFMVRIGADGKLQRVENVLDNKGFARIRPGMTEAQVLQTLGPPYPVWTAYFKARDERTWEWRYCDDWNNAAHFVVLFDGTSRTVRTALSVVEACGQAYCACSR